jgi:hypothetical protein
MEGLPYQQYVDTNAISELCEKIGPTYLEFRFSNLKVCPIILLKCLQALYD